MILLIKYSVLCHLLCHLGLGARDDIWKCVIPQVCDWNMS